MTMFAIFDLLAAFCAALVLVLVDGVSDPTEQNWYVLVICCKGCCLQVAANAASITSVYPDRGSTEGHRSNDSPQSCQLSCTDNCKGGTYLVISGSGFMMPTEAASAC